MTQFRWMTNIVKPCKCEPVIVTSTVVNISLYIAMSPTYFIRYSPYDRGSYMNQLDRELRQIVISN